MIETLREYLTGTEERVGFILLDNTIVEVDNIAHDKTAGFDVRPEDILKYEDAGGTWHTHPNGSANLSMDDYDAFLMWPDKVHYVIAPDGIKAYRVKSGRVYQDVG